MLRTRQQLRDDALAIWRAGVAAVDSRRLVRENLRRDADTLWLGDEAEPIEAPLANLGRVVVVGAGKAGAGMAKGVEEALGEEFMERHDVAGWVNVPADCAAATDGASASRIHLHPARPAGVNEPTREGVLGARKILELVASLGPRDLCLCLLSGGGSALLPSPQGVCLEEKLAITRFLSAAGANIEELNAVRKQLSEIKGGGLARACTSGRLVSLIISDVMGDPLDVIASGPTVADSTTPELAIEVLERYGAKSEPWSAKTFGYLRSKPARAGSEFSCDVANLIIGNNAVAVDAAGVEAERRGYSHAMTSSRASEGLAEDVGRHLAQMALSMRSHRGPDCLISGGEPVVKLAAASERGRGGRNQQLALAALAYISDKDSGAERPGAGIALLSGGTDGEDGPTDAAGAIVDEEVIADARRLGLNAAEHMRRNDAYRFFEPLDALIVTGPTHTNVGDLRVVAVSQVSGPQVMQAD